MTNDEENEKAECIRIHGEAFWAECVAAAKEFNEEFAQARAQAKNDAIRAALQATIAENNAKMAALQAQIDAIEARMHGHEEVHAKEAVPTLVPTRQDRADPASNEERQGSEHPVIVPRPVPTPSTSVLTSTGSKKAPATSSQRPADSALLPARAIAFPIVIPSPPPPFYVKAIPDSLVQDSLVFKCGVLAKWHAIEEEANTNSQSPSLPKSKEEIKVGEFGGERAKEEAKGVTSTDDSTRNLLAKRLRRYHLSKRRQDEWIEKFGVHSGRFKLLKSPIY